MRLATSKAKPTLKMAPQRDWRFEAIGTHWSISVCQDIDEGSWSRLARRVEHRIATFDRTYSRFRPDSLITKMAQRPGRYHLPDDAEPLFDLYRQLYDLTSGAVTPLIGQTVSDAGYDANYSLRPKELVSPPQWDEVLEYVHPYLTLKQPALLDFGAAGKGYLVDIVGKLLQSAGVASFCINAGGDVLTRGLPEPLAIGLESPLNTNQAIGVARLADGSLCGSAGSRRTWGRFHHLIDPRTLESPRHLAAVWVQADTALLADGLATALYFVAPHTLAKHYTFEWALFESAGVATYSPGFPATFFA